ncbi:MAG: YbhB/YbcL family Raf kinase inhibitor-like protein [Deltaproteobacteria bacterium]|nr:YbhB/YbcL family Raf kinase inhibitor-like protein [Deltaproteobacteria bacterium]
MRITSPAFRPQGEIPQRFTCEGANVSPPLSIDVDGVDGLGGLRGSDGDVSRAKSLAIVVDDLDAQDGSWVHWVVYNIPATTTVLPQGLTAPLPAGAREGSNSWNGIGWSGPCPPRGRHRYLFTLYALDTMLPDLGAPRKEQLEEAMQGHLVGSAQLIGTYELQLVSREEARRD